MVDPTIPATMHFFYRVLITLLAPLALLHLARKAREVEGMAGRWAERQGRLPPGSSARLWIHAASVGEVNGIAPLVEALIDEDRDRSILVSTMTATGARRVQYLFGDRVIHRFAPLDTPRAVGRWLDAVEPERVLVAETEIWPELYLQLGRKDIPLVLVNARISPSAEARYRHFRRLLGRALSSASLILCQSRSEAERFVGLGAPPGRTHVTGNLKFDVGETDDLDDRSGQLKSQWGPRPTWVAGSSHGGEEEILLQAHRILLEARPDALLVLAPRHPERAGEVLETCRQAGLAAVRQGKPVGAATAVVVLDRFGWVQAAYQVSRICFIGGSLIPVGGHNLLEPARLARPVIAGPWLHEQEAMAQCLREHDALLEVRDASALGQLLVELMDDEGRCMALGMAAARAARQGRGAVARTLEWIRREDPAPKR